MSIEYDIIFQKYIIDINNNSRIVMSYVTNYKIVKPFFTKNLISHSFLRP